MKRNPKRSFSSIFKGVSGYPVQQEARAEAAAVKKFLSEQEKAVDAILWVWLIP